MSLSNFMKANGMVYLHFAEEFGARHTDPDLLVEEGKVDFELVRKCKVNILGFSIPVVTPVVLNWSLASLLRHFYLL